MLHHVNATQRHQKQGINQGRYIHSKDGTEVKNRFEISWELKGEHLE